MTHMVIFRSPKGKPGYHQAEGLEAAMRFAEMLRNQEQVTDARIFRMDEVPIEFKTYYRVEMASAAGSGDMASAAGSGDTASAAGSGDATSEAGNGEVASASETGEVAEPVTETVDAPEPSPEPPADGWVGTMGTATGPDGEPEPAEALGPGRHGRFTRR